MFTEYNWNFPAVQQERADIHCKKSRCNSGESPAGKKRLFFGQWGGYWSLPRKG